MSSEDHWTTLRRELQYDSFSFWKNISFSNASDFDSNLRPAEDVPVNAVMTSIFFNAIVCVFLLSFYECLRRLLPAVYSSRKRLDRTRLNEPADSNRTSSTTSEQQGSSRISRIPEELPGSTSSTRVPPDGLVGQEGVEEVSSSLSSLPDNRPLDWIQPVLGVSWSKVRKIAGLDGYFFLRYIRMNVRITAVSTFWFFTILVPIYATGSNPETAAQGWYRLSASNIPARGWRMWVACVFAYLFSSFVVFVIKQEYRHFLELRQDFLAKGSSHVDPQQHYSLMIENIPYELRSDRALKDYFEKLFPGRVHSASVVLKLPDLEKASMRCTRSCRRLEKSIAYLQATGKRPTHIVGRKRMSVLGIDLAPCNCRCKPDEEAVYVDDGRYTERPERGTLVDSISYYTQELAAKSRALFLMQLRKSQIAESGNQSIKADNWFDQAMRNFSAVANRIMADSAQNNDLLSSAATFDINPDLLTPDTPVIPQAENMTSRYGTISTASLESSDKRTRLVMEDHLVDADEQQYDTPFAKDQYRNCLRRSAGRLGLDYLFALINSLNKQLDVTLEGIVGATMSSTGFVTFLDLSSTTCAASAPLTAKASALEASVAPEPREILWKNAYVSKVAQIRQEHIVNILLFFGVALWSFPLTAIQAFAKAKYLAQIPGMEWIETIHGGTLTTFVNGYLPVVGLLGLIMILPVIFEYLAVFYEHRKTFSNVQASMLSRYFYYQLANVYVTVTAGSILKSLAGILDHPSSILALLGQSLPTMVGYFVALLVTKFMVGLPMVFLRFGALLRMLFLKTLVNEKKLTQRELDAVYRLENVQYGWEFPTQLLVVVIVFTYAVICPIILPFGLLYFVGALLVYKKQVLYVYSPVYESGGAMFPIAVQHTLFGLMCAQMTFLGYNVIRGCYYQTIFLIPLPIITVYVMIYFGKTYAEPSKLLSLERAREFDRISELEGEGVETLRMKFDKSSYRQPVLTELAAEPWTYRRGIDDNETITVREQLRHINRYGSRLDQEAVQSSDEVILSPSRARQLGLEGTTQPKGS